MSIAKPTLTQLLGALLMDIVQYLLSIIKDLYQLGGDKTPFDACLFQVMHGSCDGLLNLIR